MCCVYVVYIIYIVHIVCIVCIAYIAHIVDVVSLFSCPWGRLRQPGSPCMGSFGERVGYLREHAGFCGIL